LGFVVAGCESKDYLYYTRSKNHPRTSNLRQQIKGLQLGASRVDVLWVIDNSGSMGKYQKEVIRNTQVFMENFVQIPQLQWKMGLLSTDKDNPPYLGFATGDEFDYSSRDPVGRFQAAVGRLGTSGDPTERTLLPIIQTLTANHSFLSPGASLALIFVTDAKEQSSIPSKDFLDFLTSKLGSLKFASVYGAIAANDLGCDTEEGEWKYQGSPYDEVIRATNGLVFPLCSPNFGANLAQIGKTIVSRVVKPKVHLPFRPIVDRLRVLHRDIELPRGFPEEGGIWTYDFELNAILFHTLDFAPNDSEEVEVEMLEDIGR
jgi:hypothetical protein